SATDVQPAGQLHQMPLRGVRVHAALGGAGRFAAAAARLGVARPPRGLLLPVVAHFLEGMFESGVRGATRTLTRAIGLHGAVVRLRESVLSRLGRPAQRARQVFADRHFRSPFWLVGRTELPAGESATRPAPLRIVLPAVLPKI